jgi:hypothetical protein
MVLSCGSLPGVHPVPDDRHVDALWLALSRGDLGSAEAAANLIEDVHLAERARRDVQAARSGRAAALVAALETGSWWAARYMASSEAARELLEASSTPRRSAGWILERSRRAAISERRIAWASLAAAGPVGSLEALALLGEAHFSRQDWEQLEALLADAPDSARLSDLTHRFFASTGRMLAAVEGLLSDLATGRITPTGLDLLCGLLFAVPQQAAEERARTLLALDDAPGRHWQRSRSVLLAQLLARAGELDRARQLLAAQTWLEVEHGRLLLRLQQRLSIEDGLAIHADASLEELIDADPGRIASAALSRLRLLHEWNGAAQRSYREALLGDERDLDGFLSRLDEAASSLGDVPSLAGLPRDDFGVFGEMLAVDDLTQGHPDMFVLGGQGFLLPPEISVYDRLAVRSVETPTGSYREVTVRHLRVPGFIASQGATFTGAGIVHTVFLDAERVAVEAGRIRATTLGPEQQARPAVDRESRRALIEPLDVALRLRAAASAEAGDALEQRLTESLALHEGQHIIDVQAFLARGQLGRLADLISAGLLPGAVRSEVERRAQLRSLRESSDPRLPLADLLAQLPVEGVRAESEHARGYAELLGAFVECLDRGAYEGARPLQELGLDPARVLIQQLHKLPMSVVRAIALAIDD